MVACAFKTRRILARIVLSTFFPLYKAEPFCVVKMRWCARKGGFTIIRERQNASRTIRFDSATNSIHVLASESLHGLRRHLSCVSSACYYMMTFSTSDPTFFFFFSFLLFWALLFGSCLVSAKAKNTRAQYTIVKNTTTTTTTITTHTTYSHIITNQSIY